MFVTDSSQLTANSVVEIIKSIAEHQVEVPIVGLVDKIRQILAVCENNFVNERSDRQENPNKRFNGQPDV